MLLLLNIIVWRRMVCIKKLCSINDKRHDDDYYDENDDDDEEEDDEDDDDDDCIKCTHAAYFTKGLCMVASWKLCYGCMNNCFPWNLPQCSVTKLALVVGI